MHPLRAEDHGRERCNAGVVYKDQFRVGREPCIAYMVTTKDGRSTLGKPGETMFRKEWRGADWPAPTPCSRRCEPTDDEYEAYRVEAEAHMQKTFAALKVAGEWRVKPKPASDRREAVECPICKGRLHLSQSAYNGHVHGQCETAGCVSWME